MNRLLPTLIWAFLACLAPDPGAASTCPSKNLAEGSSQGALAIPDLEKIFSDSCYLHPDGSDVGPNSACPNVDPTLTVKVYYKCEECGEMQPRKETEVIGYGECWLDNDNCSPSLIYIDYQASTVDIKIQNRRIALLVCLKNGVAQKMSSCGCPECDTGHTPVILSLDDGQIELTSAANGVLFDLDADGTLDQTAWTAGGTDDGFLVLDRNGNGLIDDGTELFGNTTPQPVPFEGERNGFAALAVFDDTLSGGNEDGVIDSRDSIFDELGLWRDLNKNGLSETGEVTPLASSGVVAIDLGYVTSPRVDRYGNEFRYRASVQTDNALRLAWDVIFQQN